MFTNRKINLFLIGTLTIALIVVLALVVAPSAAAPTVDTNVYSDYALRHPELSRSAGAVVDTSDYALRHPDLSQMKNTVDTSDYFLRHPSR